MKPNQSIEIIRVENGYMVRDGYTPSTSTGAFSIPESFLVFQSFAELSRWLAGHFDYRNEKIMPD